jgi:G3E family GTPase
MREAAIADALDPAVSSAVILEGIASGASPLDAHPSLAAPGALQRIAPGCMCCVGNLTLRVTLNRMLRNPPQRVFIGLATSTHLPQIMAFLSAPPYDQHLQLTAVLECDRS